MRSKITPPAKLHHAEVPMSLMLPDWLANGGVVMWLLLALSFVASTIIIAKLIQFSLRRPLTNHNGDEALNLLKQGHNDAALKQAQAGKDPLSQILAPVLALTANWEDEALRQARGQIEGLRGGMRALELIAAVAPLLGLLGTVFGMIEAFRALEQAGSQVDPSLLSGGIWAALLTTAAGLSIAIPTLMAFHWFDRTLERLRFLLEDRLSQLVALRARS
jgi:biopolymer transport protein ExbB